MKLTFLLINISNKGLVNHNINPIRAVLTAFNILL